MLVGLGVLLVAGVAVTVTLANRAPGGSAGPSTAAAFRQELRQHYGVAKPYVTCGRLACMTELHVGNTWYQGEAGYRIQGSHRTLVGTEIYRWKRHWSPFSKRYLSWPDPTKPSAPGVASINGSVTPASSHGRNSLAARSASHRVAPVTAALTRGTRADGASACSIASLVRVPGL